MSAKLGLYREHRPKTFSDTWGQEPIMQTLKNMVISRRIDGYSAFLFVGTRGSGKTTTSRNLAKAANCLSPVDGNPCNVCDNCLMIIGNQTTDVYEMDAASNRGVSDVENIITSAKYMPTALKRKVYIIDEVHQLSATAKDAMLKTLEDCPAHTMFILATTESKKVPATIRSRCFLFEFQNATTDLLTKFLGSILDKEHITYDNAGLEKVSQLARGSYRDALTIVEGIIVCHGNATLESVRDSQALPSQALVKEAVGALLGGDPKVVLGVVDKVLLNGGVDIPMFLSELSDILIVGARSAIINSRLVKGLSGGEIMEVGLYLSSLKKQLADETPVMLMTMPMLSAASKIVEFRSLRESK